MAYISDLVDAVRVQSEAGKQNFRVTLISILESHGYFEIRFLGRNFNCITQKA